MKRILTILTALQSTWVLPALALGTFQNLNFEGADFSGPPLDAYGRYAASNAIPGWSAYIGTSMESRILHDNVFLDAPTITVFDNQCTDPIIVSYCHVLEGTYSVYLRAGLPITGGWASASIAQTGLIPSEMKTMAFQAVGPFGSGQATGLEVSVGGQATSLHLFTAQPTFNLYGVDVSVFAGQETEIKFTSTGNPFYLDSIRFIPIQVPEPTLVIWLGVAAAFAFGRIKKAGKICERDSRKPEIQT